ncbi:LysE family transporter [Streptomyces sp. CH8.1]|nr:MULTISPECIES: LysE family transporter [Streptomyces]MBP2343998.1 arginine exporter protein ArgO [Streptomyces virginiae]MCI4081380.1 LysE family transporter [Streptomyces sp. MMS21 TC-5]QNE27456.1 lysine transporter LysE [Streptomyces sp. INR7]
MSELMTPALAGAAAGLGVAMPMGAMSVLLLQEAMRHRRTAMAAATGVAVVDLGYAALATAVGPWVASHISPVEAWVRLASAAILLAIAAHGLAGARETPPDAVTGADDPAAPAAAGPAAAGRTVTGLRPARTFARYVALTAINPTTALYFAALTTAQGATLGSGPAGAAFLVGVGVASLLWQQSLVALGSLAGARISATARVWTFRLGYGLVAAYALKIAFPLP